MQVPQRKALRLKGYDYSASGGYFITICTKDRQPYLSDLNKGQSRALPLLLPIGKIAEAEINELTKRYKILINHYVIMPDHIHMIIEINRDGQGVECTDTAKASSTIGDIICAFKSITTKIANQNDNCIGRKIWQRGYYEHIIRGGNDYVTKCKYIEDNPARYR